jgi:uncharacterized membrane protein
MAAALKSPRIDEQNLAIALGWFSLGLGLAEIVAPRSVARMIGVPEDDSSNIATLRAFGVREITSGIGILSQPRTAGWVWSRVGGDVLDLAALSNALTSDRARRDRVLAALAAVAGVTLLDMFCGKQLSERTQRNGHAHEHRATDRGIHIRRSTTVGRPPEELYRYWREVENLPRFMRSLESVRQIDDRRSHWVMRLPMGRRIEWDSEITEDSPNVRIAWRALPGGDVQHSGSVRFEPAPGGRGTMVRVEMRYEGLGAVAGGLAKLFGKIPGVQVQQELRAFKQIMEIGEIVESDASIADGAAARPPAQIPHREGVTS